MATVTLSPEELQATLDRFIGNPAAPEFVGPMLARPPQLVDWASLDIQPPTNLFIRPEDILLFKVSAIQSGTDVRLTGTILLETGELSHFEEQIFSAASAVVVQKQFNPGTGFLLHLSAWLATSDLGPGQTYVQVGILRNIGGPLVITDQLIAGSPYSQYSLNWPIGRQRNVFEGPGRSYALLETNPAAGANAISTVPAGVRRRVYGGSFTLVTDATVINRVVFVQVDDGTNVIVRATADRIQLASLSLTYSFGDFGYAQPSPNSNQPIMGLPVFNLFANYRVLVTAVNLQAGDQFSGYTLAVEDWLVF